MTQRYPNILWIQTDEQRTDSLGCYGSEWARTPHIDSLAQRGVLMANAYCQAPICSPSRSSQLACRYPQEINALSNLGAGLQGILPEGTIMFPELFEQAGYMTASIGKSHTPKHATWGANDNFCLMGAYSGYRSLSQEYNEADYGVIQRPGIPLIIGGCYPSPHSNPSKMLTDKAISFLKHRPDNQPFFLRVSHNWPHTPVLPPVPYNRLYDDTDVPVRYFDKTAYSSRSTRDREIADRERMWELTRSDYRQIWHDYMSLVAYVDHEVGRLIDYVRQAGLEKDTIILYSSDHGRALGEWGAGEKCIFDDPVWRVPFIWSWPAALEKGLVKEDLCELIDTGTTLLSLAGLSGSIPAEYRGRDLFREAAPGAVYGQMGWPTFDGVGFSADYLNAYRADQNGIPRYNTSLRMAIRKEEWRMDVEWMQNGKRVARTEMDGNVFNLKDDPFEIRNLWDSPEHRGITNELVKSLEDWFNSLEQPDFAFPKSNSGEGI